VLKPWPEILKKKKNTYKTNSTGRTRIEAE
jgi:hypothetical protein